MNVLTVNEPSLVKKNSFFRMLGIHIIYINIM